jgi:hypothetical protein
MRKAFDMQSPELNSDRNPPPVTVLIKQSPWSSWIPWAQYHVSEITIEK